MRHLLTPTQFLNGARELTDFTLLNCELQLSEWAAAAAPPDAQQQSGSGSGSGSGSPQHAQHQPATTTKNADGTGIYKANVDALVEMLEQRYPTLPLLVR